MKLLSLLIMLAVLQSGCKKSSQIQTESETLPISNSLEGSWIWTRTDGGIAAHIHETPASAGRTVKLVLRSDNTYTIYTNGNLSSQGTYSINSHNCIHEGVNKPLIDFSNDMDWTVESVINNVLSLSDEAYDGIISQYKRGN